jgi:hypothetical protein
MLSNVRCGFTLVLRAAEQGVASMQLNVAAVRCFWHLCYVQGLLLGGGVVKRCLQGAAMQGAARYHGCSAWLCVAVAVCGVGLPGWCGPLLFSVSC